MAAADTNLLTTLIPAGAVVLGYVMTMAGQAFADFRSGRREVNARLDQLTIDIYKEDREVIQRYQRVVCDLMLGYAEVHNRCAAEQLSPPPLHMTLEEKATLHGLNAEQVMLYSLLTSDAVQESASAFGEAIGNWIDSSSIPESSQRVGAIVAATGEIHKRIGAELRKTPYHRLSHRRAWWRRKRIQNRSLD